MAPRKDGSALLSSPLVETEPIKCETCKHQTGRHGTGSSGRMVYEYYCKTPGGTPCWLPGMVACSWYEEKPVCLCESCKWMEEVNPQLGWRCRPLRTWVAFKDKCPAYSEIIDVKALNVDLDKTEVNMPILCDKCEHHMAENDSSGKRFCAGFAKLVVPKTKCHTYRPAVRKPLCPDCLHCKTDRSLGGFCSIHDIFIQGFETTGCTKFQDKQAPADHGCQCDICKDYRAGVQAQKEVEEREQRSDEYDRRSAAAYRKSQRKKLEKALEAAYNIPMIHTMDRETKTVTVIVPRGWGVIVKPQ